VSGCCDPGDRNPEAAARRGAATTVLCTVATASGWLLATAGLSTASMSSLVLAYAAGGWAPSIRALQALRQRKLDVDLLMLLAALGAAVVGHWLEGGVLLALFSLGNALETYAFGRTRSSIRALMDLRPAEATRLRDGVPERVGLAALLVGDVVRVRPGDRLPVDGCVVDGQSYVDESTLTGEPVPISKDIGAAVFAGTLNGSGSLDVRMTRPANDTTLARVIRMVEDARETQAPTQSWIQGVESRYAAAVIVGAIVAILVPWLLLGWSVDDAFYRAMTLLVVASPCALVISIPATIVAAVSNGARHGVLFKGGAHLDALADIRAIALDKTGTLTVGRPELAKLCLMTPAVAGEASAPSTEDGLLDENLVLQLIAAAESRSEHPLGAALVRAAAERGLEVPEPSSFRSFPGRGIEATVSGKRIRVGRPTWISNQPPQSTYEDAALTDEVSQGGMTPILASIDGNVAAALWVQDALRPGAQGALEALRDAGIEHLVMLTGDAASSAHRVAEALNLDDVRSSLLPDEKAAFLADVRRQHGPVAMVGDGVNDAPALATADVGIALGAVGSDVALETADVVVMGDDLNAISHAIRLSHRARRIVRQNLVFSVGVMIALVVLAISGNIGLTAGVIGHEGSTVLVVFNGLRLLADGGSA